MEGVPGLAKTLTVRTLARCVDTTFRRLQFTPDLLPADLILLNPPRSGLAESVPPLLKDHGVQRVIYVSCDPATLSRDLQRLGPGYQVLRVRSFDLFPQTAHVETVISLTGKDGGLE